MPNRARWIAAFGMAVGLLAVSAEAATTAQQLVDLAHAGVDDDVLIALIETDGSTFRLGADDILSLHQQGLSDRVIRAMQESARVAPPPAPPAASPVFATPVTPVTPLATVAPGAAMAPVESVIAVPLFVPVPVPAHVRPERKAPPAPVYWGWGGQRRPDSWDDGAEKQASSGVKGARRPE